MAIALTTEFQKVAEASTKVTSNVTGYLRLYLKYGDRDKDNNQDTIYYEIRQLAYNPYGKYYAWEWTGSYNWSIKFGDETKANGSYTQSAIYSTKTDALEYEVVRASGSWVQKHNLDGSFSTSLTIKGYVYKTELTATADITLPTIPVVPTLKINSSTDMTTSGSTISYTLGNTGNRNTDLQYSTNNSTWVTLQSKSADGTYSVTLPNLLSTFPDTSTPSIYFRATNVGGTTGVITQKITIDASIKPNISSVTITPSNTYSVLANAGLFVRTLTMPIIKTSASAGTGSTISSYDLTSLGGYTSNISKMGIGSSYTYGIAFQKSGSYNATVNVTDKRGRSTSKTSSNITVIDYSTPSLSISVLRCDSDGITNSNGTYCKLICNYNIYPITSGNTNYNTKKLSYSIENGSYTDISISSYSGTSTTIISGNFAVSSTYKINVKLQDLTTTVALNTTLPSAETTISKRAGGKGVTFGRVATEDGFHSYMDATFHGNVEGPIVSSNIPVISNCNDLELKTGFYWANGTATGVPSSSNAWFIQQIRATGYITQIAYKIGSDGIYYRSYGFDSGGWYAWTSMIFGRNLVQSYNEGADVAYSANYSNNHFGVYTLWSGDIVPTAYNLGFGAEFPANKRAYDFHFCLARFRIYGLEWWFPFKAGVYAEGRNHSGYWGLDSSKNAHLTFYYGGYGGFNYQVKETKGIALSDIHLLEIIGIGKI